ncbi:hypothetical protein AWZ03_003982 [Drosophila navojoa]|uniref:Uncharacterized protein n=1 Tax=Drosophila navojoa TaxID=7232 RepID=A0A484BP47_DRONA|nr:hypothetical protein AWZ03_003982 [Drosophila navojoa]
MAKDLSTLGWDYFMFVAFIALTVLGPLWTRIFGKSKQRSKADYVFATGGVSLVAVMISIARGTLGVRSVLGYPSELYYRGSAMWEIIYGMMSAYPIVCFMFVPVYFNLGITSVYQYIDLSFDNKIQLIAKTDKRYALSSRRSAGSEGSAGSRSAGSKFDSAAA